MQRRIMCRGAILPVAVACLIGGLTGTAGRAYANVARVAAVSAASGSVTGWTRAPGGLKVSEGPGSRFPSLDVLPYNTKVTVIAYENGSDVNGDPYWDVIHYNNVDAFLADYWVYTGGNINQQVQDYNFTPGVAEEPGGLPLYSSPGSGLNRTIAQGTIIGVYCYATGPVVNGDRYWDESYYGYASDYWLYTGTDITTQVPHC